MSRKYFKYSIAQLDEIFRSNLRERSVLAEIHEELQHRKTDHAKQLRRAIQGILDGDVPAPKRPFRPDVPENQEKLFD